MWNLACPDWEYRIKNRLSLIPDLPLFVEEGDIAVEFFDSLTLPDVIDTPKLKDACGDWFRQLVRTVFGSRDPKTNTRYIREFFALVSKGNSKAVDLDTQIATPSGFTTMRDVHVGDLVIDCNGRPTMVIEKSIVFIGRPCFEVEFSTGETVVCDAEHLWVTDSHVDRGRQRGDRKIPCPTVKKTSEIADTLKVKSGAYQINNHRTSLAGALDLPEANLPIPPYALGAWLGDGTTTQACITAGLADCDFLVEKLVANGQPAFVRARYPEKGSTTISLGVPNTVNLKIPYRFRTEAVKLNLLGNKHVPAVYLRGSYQQRLELLRGLMDTDGSISKTGQASYTTTLPGLRDDVVELVNSLGFKASWSEHRSALNGVDYGPVWNVQFWPFDDEIVFTMPRKAERQKARAATTAALSRSRQIVAVRRVPSVPVQCIAVASETKQYLVTRSLIPTHNTSYGAGLMVTALLMNTKRNAEFLFVAPTQAVAEIAYNQAVGMVQADEQLSNRFHIIDHKKTIHDRNNKSNLKIKTFDLNILTGPKPSGVLLDELHLLGKNSATPKVLRQLRGGMEKSPEAFMVILTTQSDDMPAGAFKIELSTAKKIRDGLMPGRMLPILYEFPKDIAKDQQKWSDPTYWPMVMPNLGKSLQIDSLIADWETEKTKGDQAIRVWASQHLNIEIGLGLANERWAGADFWERQTQDSLTLEEVLYRSEVVVVGIDGGGADDLFGMAVLGREQDTKNWLLWSHAWCHEGVLEKRKSIAARLLDFKASFDLTIVDDELEDISEIVGIISNINSRKLLAGVSVDPAGLGELIDELAKVGITQEGEQIFGAPQGYAMMNAIKTTERKLINKTMWHAPGAMMNWCVSNLKIEPMATAIRVTKQNAGDLKIDPAMAMFDAAVLMSKNPAAPSGNSYLAKADRLVVLR